jgi:2'-5' RNA ligase superfamily
VNSLRRQATLFLRHAELDRLRLKWNPEQASLISTHVTLIREDEVDDWEALAERLGRTQVSVQLEFGKPQRDGHFVYYPCVAGQDLFQRLRCELLQVSLEMLHKPQPHITLIHPRNGHCTDTKFAEVLELAQPFGWCFDTVSLIEQTAGGCWREI